MPIEMADIIYPRSRLSPIIHIASFVILRRAAGLVKGRTKKRLPLTRGRRFFRASLLDVEARDLAEGQGRVREDRAGRGRQEVLGLVRLADDDDVVVVAGGQAGDGISRGPRRDRRRPGRGDEDRADADGRVLVVDEHDVPLRARNGIPGEGGGADIGLAHRRRGQGQQAERGDREDGG